MFYFQQMFLTALNGIDSSGILTAVMQIGNAILVLAALFGVYEAYTRGGDARALGIVAVRYLLLGLVIKGYPGVFRSVNSAFSGLAATISPNDFLSNFMDQAYSYYLATSSSWWNMVTGGLAAAISLHIQLAGAAIFPITYALFSLLYAMYGSILYVCGPLVIALYPSLGVGQLARTYLVNLMIFQAWGIIYAVFTMLLTAINANSLSAIFAAGSFWNWFQGSSQAMLLALSSILFSLAVALIPFLARRIVSGDVGSSVFALAQAAMTAISTTKLVAAGGASGFGAGASKGSGGEAGGSSGSGGSGSSGGGPSPAGRSSQNAPTPPAERVPPNLAGFSSEPAGDLPLSPGNSAPSAPTGAISVRSAGGTQQQPSASGENSVGGGAPSGSTQPVQTSGRSGHNGGTRVRSVRHAVGYGMGYAAGTVVRWGRQVF